MKQFPKGSRDANPRTRGILRYEGVQVEMCFHYYSHILVFTSSSGFTGYISFISFDTFMSSITTSLDVLGCFRLKNRKFGNPTFTANEILLFPILVKSPQNFEN